MNGIIIVDKPADWTSMDVCAKLRGALHERRVGHSGTLDPMATGVLAVFVGRATRAVSFCEADDKEYLATLRLGLVTNTQDVTGETLSRQPVQVTDEALIQALRTFTGDILQVPPMYSAVKIGGKKMYELARRGLTVERPPRPVTIHNLELLSREGDDVYLRVVCSKGTYIRTLCQDIGAALGCGGCLAMLRRSRCGRFRLEDAHSLDAVLAAPGEALLPVDSAFSMYPAIALQSGDTIRCRNGNPIPCPGKSAGFYRVYGEDGAFLMLGKVESESLYTVKSFFEVS